jgi:hypothetical protein
VELKNRSYAIGDCFDAVYNGEPELREALNSRSDQSRGFELLTWLHRGYSRHSFGLVAFIGAAGSVFRHAC